jgi:hypothetical protein
MTNFTLDISKWVKKAGANTDKVIKKIIIDLGTGLVETTPVGDAKYWKNPAPKGYVGGRARANWQYGFSAMPTGELNIVDPGGQTTINKIRSSITQVAGVHWIANNVDYIEALENGWSRQAPNGMLRVTVMRFQQIAKGAASGVN